MAADTRVDLLREILNGLRSPNIEERDEATELLFRLRDVVDLTLDHDGLAETAGDALDAFIAEESARVRELREAAEAEMREAAR